MKDNNNIEDSIKIGDMSDNPLFGNPDTNGKVYEVDEDGFTITENDIDITKEEDDTVKDEQLNNGVSLEELTLDSERREIKSVNDDIVIEENGEIVSDEEQNQDVFTLEDGVIDLEIKEDILDDSEEYYDFDDIAPYISKEIDDGYISKPKRKKHREKKGKLWDRMSRGSKVATIIAASMLLVVTVILIVGNTIFAGVFKDFSKANAQKEKFDTTKQFQGKKVEEVKAEDFNWDIIKGDPTYDENVYNILLLGGDNAKSTGQRGNSDTIMIISIDKNTKKLKVTSIMRDTYVQIPGYRDNKINSAFATGGVPLIKKTIEENFKITIDSAVVLNYSTFRTVIDELGGVDDVTINEKEARFINKECRKKNVKSDLTEGTHHLNAYQALHFARIRKISSEIYGSDDFGRTARQRFVMNQVFKKYKDLSYAKLAKLATKVIKEVEVDKNLRKDMFLLLQVVLKFDVESLEEFRVPMDKYYSFADVAISGSSKRMSVVNIDNYLEENIDGLHLFIYGEELYGTDFDDDDDDDDSGSTRSPSSTNSANRRSSSNNSSSSNRSSSSSNSSSSNRSSSTSRPSSTNRSNSTKSTSSTNRSNSTSSTSSTSNSSSNSKGTTNKGSGSTSPTNSATSSTSSTSNSSNYSTTSSPSYGN